jgi:ribose transport system permease protein
VTKDNVYASPAREGEPSLAVPGIGGDQPQKGERRPGLSHYLGRAVTAREYGIVIAFGALFAYLALSSGQFLTKDNLLNIVDQETSIGLIACAGTLVVISGCFDLSVGAIFALSGVVAAKLALSLGTPEAFAIALLAGAGLGLINGILVSTVRINPLIATLATSIIFGGVALVITNGFLIDVGSSSFSAIGLGKPLGVYWSTWIFLVFAIVMAVTLGRTRFGRYTFAVGGNEEAAFLSGVRVGLVRTTTYVLSGFAAALASVLFTSRIQTAQPNAGSTFALSAIAAIVVGGTSIGGGEGAVWRTVIGVLFLGMIADGFTLLSINPLYQEIVQGTIILAAVSLDVLAKRNRR